jgi:hypothetical protein
MTQEFSFSRRKYRESLDYPKQFVRLEPTKAIVGIDKENTIEINRHLGRLILFLMKTRNKEGSLPLNRIKSETLKRLTLLSNCHRVMLFLFGFKPNDTKNQEAGSTIIENYFNNGLKPSSLAEIENDIKAYSSSDFPLALNFFLEDVTTKKHEARHSVMILGRLSDGKILCFHKDGIGNSMPMCLTTLDKIYESNKKEYHYSLLDNQQAEQIYRQFKVDNQ